MTNEDENIGGLFAELFGPTGGFLLWSRDPKRKRDNNDLMVATDAKDNDRIQVYPDQALLLLDYLQRHRTDFEKAIVAEALKRASK